MITNNIPSFLYRGDADKYGTRKLKLTIDNYQFQTNLINGGEGRMIFEKPLKELIDKHVGVGWDKTHFLSFSEDVLTAYKYGSGNLSLKSEEIDLLYDEYYETNSNWDFAIINLDTRKIVWNNIEPGVYEGIYKPQLFKFSRLNTGYRVLLLHVETILKSSVGAKYFTSVGKAMIDKEWLLLPATTVPLNFNKSEYSAILDGGEKISFKKIKKNFFQDFYAAPFIS